MTDEDGPVTLPGVLVLDFDGGRCRNSPHLLEILYDGEC